MLLNCDGLKSQSKQASFCVSIVHHNPHIIFGSESKISPDIATYSQKTIMCTEKKQEGGVFKESV